MTVYNIIQNKVPNHFYIQNQFSCKKIFLTYDLWLPGVRLLHIFKIGKGKNCRRFFLSSLDRFENNTVRFS